jgi:SWIM/SEC-C metal-binding protein
MAQLGSKKNPAIVHVKTQERAMEIIELCIEHGWQVVVGIEPGKSEDISDLTKLLARPEPTIKKITAGRNDPCPCGSGLKFKKCCLNTEKAKPLMKKQGKKWWQIWKSS